MRLDTSFCYIADGDGLEAISADMVSSHAPYQFCTLDSGVQVSWYQHLKDVPKGQPPHFIEKHLFLLLIWFSSLTIHMQATLILLLMNSLMLYQCINFRLETHHFHSVVSPSIPWEG